MFVEVTNIKNTRLSDNSSRWPKKFLINIDAISSIYTIPNSHEEITDGGEIPDDFTVITFDKVIKIATLNPRDERKASYIVSPESYKK